MATTKTYQIGEWDTIHNNGPFPTKIMYETLLEKKQIMPGKIDRYNDAGVEIRRLLKNCLEENERFRAFGSSWSLSKIAHQKDRMHYNAAMNISITIKQQNMHSDTNFKHENLFLFQCGNTIKEVSRYLFEHGKSLKASGASNGQTIAGAISTGVHGAALDVGSVQDCVVGINLVIGPNTEDVVYLERHSEPALNNEFAASINSRVIRNDGLFNAALVGLGSFGFVMGYVIEAEDLFLLKRYTKKIKRSEAINLAENLDFRNSDFTVDNETDADGKGNRPYHFKVYINPYNETEDYVTEIMYKKPYRTDYTDPVPNVEKFIYKDLPDWISGFAARHNRLIPKMIDALKGEIFPELDQETEGTLGEIFWDTSHKGPAFAWAFGIDNKDTQKALDLFVKLVNEEGPVPGAMAFRLVKVSKATLAFTRFPVTCVLEMDGLLWRGNRKMISMEDFERKIIEQFKAYDIPFTWHWGKNAAWNFPGLIDYMYGDKDDEWKNYRSALLSKEMADLFSNDFLNTAGLSDYRKNAPAELARSL